MRLPGAPTSDKFPPITAANTRGISSLERAKPERVAIPIATRIKLAAVPVLDKKPDIIPIMSIIAIINCRSVFANLVTTPPILFAMLVSNKAAPIMNLQRIECH